MLTLYRWEPAGASLAVLICLKEKGLAFESRFVDAMALAHYAPEMLKRSPRGEIPVLIDGDLTMTDGEYMTEYLAEAYPSPRLAAADAEGWYDTQAWTTFVHTALAPSIQYLGWHTVSFPALSKSQREAYLEKRAAIRSEGEAGWAQVTHDAEASEDQIANARERIAAGVRRIEAALASSPWLAGGGYSIADILAYAHTRSLPRLTSETVNAKATPKTLDWLKRIEARPAVKAALGLQGPAGDGDLYAPV